MGILGGFVLTKRGTEKKPKWRPVENVRVGDLVLCKKNGKASFVSISDLHHSKQLNGGFNITLYTDSPKCYNSCVRVSPRTLLDVRHEGTAKRMYASDLYHMALNGEELVFDIVEVENNKIYLGEGHPLDCSFTKTRGNFFENEVDFRVKGIDYSIAVRATESYSAVFIPLNV